MSGLIFECCGIARAVPIIKDKIKVFIDFHIFAILEFDLLIGCPLDKLSKQKPFHGSLDERFGKTSFATHSDIPIVKHHPNNDPFEEVKFVSPFVSPELSCETECSSPPSLEPKSCPSGHPSIVLDCGRDSTLILHDKTLRNENSCAMDILLSDMCSYEDSNHLLILIPKLFRRMVVDAFVYHKYCKSRSFMVALTLQLEH